MMHGPMNVKNVYKHIIIIIIDSSWFLYVCVYMYVFYYSITAGAVNDNLAVVELNSVVTKISIIRACIYPS